jgi:hypothetical protein
MRFRSPRKQRTRQHVIADQSIHYLEGFIIDEGHTAKRLEQDYGFDLVVFTFDELGYVEPGCLLFQLKAREELVAKDAKYVFDLDVRDYNLWTLERTPVILILYDALRRQAFWLWIQQYFRDPNRLPKRGAKTVRVRVPSKQRVNRRAIGKMRALKMSAQVRLAGEEDEEN